MLMVWPAISGAQSASSPADGPAEKAIQFADYLFSHQEYYRALGEYERFLFLSPETPEAPRAALRIAECYFNGKLWRLALEAAESFLNRYVPGPLEGKVLLLKARCLLELGRGDRARAELERIIQDHSAEPIAAEAWYLKGLSFAKEGRYLEADESLRQVGNQSTLYSAARGMRQVLAEAPGTRRKDPTVAGVLAAVLPGAGHFYCERPGDGAAAFAFTGAFTWATLEAFQQNHEELGIGLGLVALAFYGGNIFSAVNVAHKYNEREEKRRQDRLAPFERLSLEVRPGPSPALMLTLHF
jgi:tetratricopeptide (TPR) repeat protein